MGVKYLFFSYADKTLLILDDNLSIEMDLVVFVYGYSSI